MAQANSGPTPAASSGMARVLRALDERWWLRHGLFWAVRTVLMTGLFLFGLHAPTDWHRALRDSLILLPPLLLATYSLLYGVLPWLGRAGHRTRFWLLLLTAGVAACLHVLRQHQRQERGNALLAQENYQAELQLLRAQIPQHFQFNTLNNLYTLTLKQSDQAQLVVERLTGLLHFVLEQGTAPLVSLPAEVTLLRNVRQRLELLYPQRHRLQVRAEDDTFAVYLALRLRPATASAPRPVAVGTASSVAKTAGQLVATSRP